MKGLAWSRLSARLCSRRPGRHARRPDREARARIDCPGDCNEFFPDGSSVTLTQVAAPGSKFTGWNGSNSRDPSILLIVGLPFPGDRIVTATFER